jgi:hypothetical protein
METYTYTVEVKVDADDEYMERAIQEWLEGRLGTPDIIDIRGDDYTIKGVEVS